MRNVAAPGRFGPALLLAAALLSVWYAPYRLPPSDEGAVLTHAKSL